MKLFIWLVDLYRKLEQADKDHAERIKKAREFEEQLSIRRDSRPSFSFSNQLQNVPINTGERLFKMMEDRNRDL